MADGTQMESALTGKTLCKGCKFSFGLIGNRVDCKSAHRHVEPVLRTEARRYEDCPHRRKEDGGLGTLSGSQLIKSAAFARQNRGASKQVQQQFEQSLRDGDTTH